MRVCVLSSGCVAGSLFLYIRFFGSDLSGSGLWRSLSSQKRAFRSSSAEFYSFGFPAGFVPKMGPHVAASGPYRRTARDLNLARCTLGSKVMKLDADPIPKW